MQIPTSVVTPEQRALEEKARELWQHPRVQGAMAKAKALMLNGYGVDIPADVVDRFDAAMDEYGFSYVERVLCRDRNNFCVHYTCHPPYDAPDRGHVPGCRFYGENPDCFYRWGGVDPDRSYKLTCTPEGAAPISGSLALMGTYGGTTPGASITFAAAQKEADGSFVITMDTSPANGRPNHLQMIKSTRLLLIREFLGDWETETPVAMRLEAEGVTRGGPWGDEAALEDITYFMVEELYLYFWMNHIYRNLEPNSVKGPAAAAAMGGSASMATAQAFFQFAEDEAVVLTWDPADAAISGLSALDWWFQPIEAHRMQSSLNNKQAVVGADGRITAVLAAKDPGVVNWVETQGLRDVILTGRWQDLPPNPPREGPKLGARLVKLADLDASLPKDMARITPAERIERNARRLAAYTRRTGSADAVFVNVE